ncbi:hypothetical protein [Porphyromonas somerae]|uniref:hypothetical protein n=1 Tax=Porphyromonas somerae TaxID=322095 RepID=UPI002A75F9A5|nr:hypothetical protein [Porphyromonas somerae]MDY3119910.1 hypothetical protein [Porphyromonas somerae]
MRPFIDKIKYIGVAIAITTLMLSATSCHEFIFGNIHVDDSENPILQKKAPRTGADRYYGDEEWQHKLPIDKNAKVPNPDLDGAFANWYTCLVMMKEGHSHYFGKLHGNPVYERKPWKQEQFAEIRNTPNGPELIMDRHSIRNFLEEQRGEDGPNYFRLVGGPAKLWALCLYFYDKEGNLINDKILKQSDQYQIFFSISDKDDKGKPYKIMDVRYRKGGPDDIYAEGHKIDGNEVGDPIKGIEAEYFKGKDSFEERSAASPELFQYTYRDTWLHDDMADGARNFFNIKLLPPYGSNDIYVVTTHDQDYVGLKGHFLFDFPLEKDNSGLTSSEGLDGMEWPFALLGTTRAYGRTSYLLPQFYLAIRVMKCEKGKKAVVPPDDIAFNDDKGHTKSAKACALSYAPDPRSEWTELIRVNIPIKIFTYTYDTDPTGDDPMEPYYYHIGREVKLSPNDIYELLNSSNDNGEVRFGAWFL